MYTPTHFAEEDPDVLFAFMQEHPFATLITHDTSGPIASHLPVEITKSPGEGKLHIRGHLARDNPHWELFGSSARSLFIFHGPHNYISPAWYQSQNLVPTWNYAVVHAYGCPSVIEDPGDTRALLDALVDRFEEGRSQPWANHLDPSLMEGLQSSIVAFDCRVEELQGKFKLGQNRRIQDQESALEALEAEAGNPELAQLTRDRLKGKTA